MSRVDPARGRRIGAMVAIVFASVFPISKACSQAPASISLDQDIQTTIAAANSAFRAIEPTAIESARQEALAAARELEAFLRLGGTAENADKWLDYLRWAAMQQELDKPSQPDLSVLLQSAAQFYRHEKGLHLKRFTRLRDALMSYINAVGFSGLPDLNKAYQQQLDGLSQSLKALQDTPGEPEAGRRVGQALGWLSRAGQAPALVQRVRSQYFYDNLEARVSRDLIAAGVEDEVQETLDVQDYILGTSIYGTAETEGTLRLSLVPNDERANLRIHLQGTAVSNNIGYNRSVRVFTQGLTTITAEKDLFMSSMGLGDTPAWATCQTSSNISDIQANSCLVEKLAWRRAGKTRSQAESIASTHAEARVASQMDDRAAEMLVEARQSFEEKFREPLVRRGEFPQQLQFSTTGDALQVRFQQANESQAAATTPAPAMDDQQDLAVRLHETWVSNFSRAMLGGVTLSDERLEELLTESGREVPDELKTGPDKEAWSITFSANDPVSASFRDDTVRFAIRGDQFTQGDKPEITDQMELSATYRWERTPGGVHLTREGDVVVVFVNVRGQTLGPSQIAIRTLFRAKFEALFKPEFTTEGLQLPGRWEHAGKLMLQDLSSQGGWLALGWLLAADPVEQLANR